MRNLPLATLSRGEKGLFSNLIYNSNEVFFETNSSGLMVFLNAAWTKITGYPLEECLGHSILEYIYKPDLQKVYPFLAKSHKGEEREEEKILSWEEEVWFQTSNGTPKLLKIQACSIFESDGNLSSISGTLTTTSGKKLPEENLLNKNHRFLYKTLIKNFPDGVVGLFDKNLSFSFIDGQGLKALNLSSEELVGKPLQDIYPPDLALHLEELFINTLAGKVQTGNVVFRDHHYLIRTAPLLDEQGQIYSGMVLAQDITYLKQTEEALRISEAKYKTLFEIAPIGLYLSDGLGNFIEANEASSNLLGLSPQELTTRTIDSPKWKVIRPDGTIKPADEFPAVRAFRENKVTQNVEMGIQKPDGSITWVTANAAPLPVEVGNVRVALALTDITPLKNARDEKEKAVQDILDRITTCFFALDTNWCFTHLNKAAEKVLRHSKEELLGKDILTVFKVGEDSSFFKQFYLAMGEQKAVEFEAVYPQFSAYFKVYAYPSPNGLSVFFEDISERIKAHEERQRQQELYRLLARHFPNGGVFLFDREMRFLITEGNALDEAGFKKEQIEGKLISEVLPPERAASLTPFFQAALNGETIGREIFYPENGRTYLNTFVAVRDDQGLIFAGMLVSYDITERKHIEQELRFSEERLKLVMQATNDVIWDWNLLTDELWWNQNLQEHFGYNQAEVPPDINWWLSHIHPEDQDRIHLDIDAAINNGEIYWSADYRFQRGDGTYAYIYDRGFVVRQADGRPVRMLGAMQDISERKQVELDLQKTQEQFRQSQKMEALGQLAGGVAHDFNNILTGILSYCELIEMKLASHDPLHLRKDLAQIITGVNRATSLTHQLLAYSRKQVLQPKPLSLNKLLHDFDKLLRRVIGENIEISYKLSPTLKLVKADMTQLHQVLLNLSINARDAMPGGGKLLFETKNVELDESYSTKSLDVKPGEYVMFSITDNGTGIDEAIRSQIFEPFFTTKEVGKGTGLGLSTVYGIIRQSSGYIFVYSEIGIGSTFKIYLPAFTDSKLAFNEMEVEDLEAFAISSNMATDSPASLQRESKSKKEEGPSPGKPGLKQTVLLVEDDQMLRETEQMILEMDGYRVLAAGNPLEALSILPENGNSIDLVITDLIMPGMNGVDFARKLQEIAPAIKVVFMSGYTSGLLDNLDFESLTQNFLEKPFTAQQLLKKVKEILVIPWSGPIVPDQTES